MHLFIPMSAFSTKRKAIVHHKWHLSFFALKISTVSKENKSFSSSHWNFDSIIFFFLEIWRNSFQVFLWLLSIIAVLLLIILWLAAVWRQMKLVWEESFGWSVCSSTQALRIIYSLYVHCKIRWSSNHGVYAKPSGAQQWPNCSQTFSNERPSGWSERALQSFSSRRDVWAEVDKRWRATQLSVSRHSFLKCTMFNIQVQSKV